MLPASSAVCHEPGLTRLSISIAVPGWTALLLFVFFNLGCLGAKVEVPSQFPIPLIEPIPLSVGVIIDDKLRSYQFSQSIEKGGDWEIKLGSAQQPMFSQLFGGVFSHAEILEGIPASETSFAGIFQPSIEEVQFSTPTQTRSDYFEVWIRYQFKLLDSRGQLLGEWPLAAYGKANEGNYGMNPDAGALQAAALAATRDAMAFFTLQLRTIPVVDTWIKSQVGSESP